MRIQDGELAILLPGQGSQYVGMGQDLADSVPEIRELYARADEVAGVALSEISWSGPQKLLTQTENAQPAILLHSYAVWISLPEELRRGTVVAAGHSLGEFSAYLIAGALSFEEALRLVRLRGELMARAGRESPGTMAAVLGLDADDVARICEEIEGTVVPANFNAPGQIVISGEIGAVGRASDALLVAGARRVVALDVSGAFHSPLMESARIELAEALDAAEIDDPEFPVVANVSAKPVTDGKTARRLLIEQLTGAVRWSDSILAMKKMGPSRWVEAGPGSVLTGLLRRIDRSLDGRAIGRLDALEAAREGVGSP